MTETKILLTKTLRTGADCTVAIVPDPIARDSGVTLCWWLEVTVGDLQGRIKARPHEIVPVNGSTYALTLPAEIVRALKGAKVIGLAGGEAKEINDGIEAWVESRKAAATAAEAEAERHARAAVPGADTWEIQDPHGVPAVGQTMRHEGRLVTVLRAWSRYYPEEGLSFGAAEDAGHVYSAEVRAASTEESSPVLEGESRERRLTELARIARSARLPGPDEEMGDLLALPQVQITPLVQLAVDETAGTVWVLEYNGADGDDWSLSNYRAYIVRRMPLAGACSELGRQL
ncbi:MAG: hypothetical protein ACRDRX_04355 [Pseudonocardiaceae bacterium]